MSVKFSVIINTFQRKNREFDLNRSFTSVENQTYKPEEIIIINSGKTKLDTKNIFKGTKIEYKIINCGAEVNIPKKRNIASKNTKYQYIAFLDDDDFWDKNYLFKSSNFIKTNNSEVLLSDVYIEKNNKLELFRSPRSNHYEDYLLNNPGAMGSNIIIKKEIFNLIGGYDERLYVSEDKSIIIDLILKKIKIEFQENVVIYNIDNPNSISKSSLSLIKGMIPFYIKYKKIMNLQTKINFLKKIYSYKKNLNKIYLINFIFFLLI